MPDNPEGDTMRILGFSRKWLKLHLELPVDQRPEFGTWRLPRKDADRGRDWHPLEQVQIVYHPRSKDREILGTAIIAQKMHTVVGSGISDEEAVADGFPGGFEEMQQWLVKTHETTWGELALRPINKLTLKWSV